MNDAPSNTPTSAAVDAGQARAEIAKLKSDPAFQSSWGSGNADARQRMHQLHQAAYPGSFNPNDGTMSSDAPAGPTVAEQAQTRIAALRKDPEWAKRWANRDAQARMEFDSLMQKAYPGETSTSIDPTVPAPDATAQEIDAAFKPAQPHEYEMPVITDEAGNHGPNETRAAQYFGEALSVGGLPREIGSHILREGARADAITRNMTDAQFQTYADQQRGILEKMWGEKTSANIELAKRLVHEIDEAKPGLKAVLNAMPGVQANANVIAQLYMQAQRLFDRNVKGK
ncbi:MAG: hypothetical protein GEV05_11175 [Betaproteobacteria bacterium]|nr:hypothetical protein [Betaproteobacteria bacterium]